MANGIDDLRIAHIISALGKGGMEFAVSRLALEQKKMGYDVSMICIRELGSTAEMLISGGVPVHLCPLKSRVNPFSLFRLRSLLCELKINVAQTHNYRPNVSGVIAAKMARIPVIVSSLRTVNRWDTYRQFLMDRFVCLFRDAIVCVSKEVRDRYIEKIKWRPEKLRVIHNGIDPELLKQREKADYLYSKHGLKREDRHIASIARLVRIKDHSTLLKALKVIISERKDVKLLLLGEGPLKEDIEKEARNLGIEENVLFLGHQQNIPDWLTIADISILSTHVEGFSSTILESMAVGVPVIATNVGGNPEAIEDGVTGFLTPPSDAGAIAEKALLILDNPQIAREIREKARQKVAESFTIDVTAKKTIELYRNILQKKFGIGISQ
ncbi:glycosyltransferase [Candidatus Sumerlaeota bacterium]|nr:glycosyltransferase [Candidatus Sumerlaeota bacterium]